jgi:hypothetical protein
MGECSSPGSNRGLDRERVVSLAPTPLERWLHPHGIIGDRDGQDSNLALVRPKHSSSSAGRLAQRDCRVFGSWSSNCTTHYDRATATEQSRVHVSSQGVLREVLGNTTPGQGGCRPCWVRHRRTDPGRSSQRSVPPSMGIPTWSRHASTPSERGSDEHPVGLAFRVRRRRDSNPDHDRDRAVCSPGYTTSAP